MGAPHWALLYLTAQRTAALGAPAWQEVQTMLRTMAVLVRTAVSWLRTGFKRENRGVAFAAFWDEHIQLLAYGNLVDGVALCGFGPSWPDADA